MVGKTLGGSSSIPLKNNQDTPLPPTDQWLYWDGKLMNDGEKAAKNVAEQVKQKTLDKNKLIQEIEKVQAEINAVDTSCKKIEDDLIVSKQHKKFLDILAI